MITSIQKINKTILKYNNKNITRIPLLYLSSSSSTSSSSTSTTSKLFKFFKTIFFFPILISGSFLIGYYYEELPLKSFIDTYINNNNNNISNNNLNTLNLLKKQREKLTIKELNETLENYKRTISISNNEDPQLKKMRDNLNSLNFTFSKLKLTKEQINILQTAQETYQKENKKIVKDISKLTNSYDILIKARKDAITSNDVNLPSRTEQLERLLKLKFEIEQKYINIVVNTLSMLQYNQWLDELQKSGNRNLLSSWIGLLNSSPVSVPLPNKRSVYVLNFKGDIRASQVSKLRNEITAIIDNAKESDEVVVVLNSRGGEVSSYGLAAVQLDRIKTAGLQLTVCVDEVAASGGYLMACVADRLIASPFASLGSIGVIATVPNVYERLKREGVQVDEIIAGKNKRSLTPFKKVNENDKKTLQNDIEAIHFIFKEFVKRYRPNLKIDDVATGQVWLGYDAIKKGLCDELKTSDDVLLDMAKSGAKVLLVSTATKPKTPFNILFPSDDDDSDQGSVDNSQLYFILEQLLKFFFSSQSNSSSSSSSSSFDSNSNYYDPYLSYNQRAMISESNRYNNINEDDE